MKLLSISPLTFVESLGPSLMEGLLLKKTGDSRLYGRCIKYRILCHQLKLLHEKRYSTFISKSKNDYNGTIVWFDLKSNTHFLEFMSDFEKFIFQLILKDEI